MVRCWCDVRVRVRGGEVLLTAIPGEWISCRKPSCLLEASEDGVLQCTKPELLLVGSASVDGVRS